MERFVRTVVILYTLERILCFGVARDRAIHRNLLASFVAVDDSCKIQDIEFLMSCILFELFIGYELHLLRKMLSF